MDAHWPSAAYFPRLNLSHARGGACSVDAMHRNVGGIHVCPMVVLERCNFAVRRRLIDLRYGIERRADGKNEMNGLDLVIVNLVAGR
jgi:hypothetical protein